MISLLKKPSAWIPLALSVAMLLLLGFYLTGILAPDPSGDEGAGAHLFQIWLLVEPITIVFFVARWLRTRPHEALAIAGLQIALALVPVITVFSFHL